MRDLLAAAGCRRFPLSDPVDVLILDLLEWIGPDSKPYAEVMAAWRTSCPRLPIWEDATDRGFIARRFEEGVGAVISLTALGQEHLARHRAR
jgi:hypothetical protein